MAAAMLANVEMVVEADEMPEKTFLMSDVAVVVVVVDVGVADVVVEGAGWSAFCRSAASRSRSFFSCS